MKIKLWGVRGSIPTSSPETKNYGGNTSCAVVSEGDNLLVLDGGSGMQQVSFGTPILNKRVDILLTHLHLDHIQGLGFFKPFFDPNLEVHIWGPASNTQTLHSRLSRYLSPPLFPVMMRDLPCGLNFHEIENSEFTIGPFNIKSAYVIHPGPTVGYRIKGKHSVFTYIPDHEPALGREGMLKDNKWISGYELVADADLLFHDGQYTAAEYQNKKGWGHSSVDDALLLASKARVKHLLLAHHDPTHTDTQLNEMYSDLKRNNHYSFEYEMAVEGMEFELP